VAAAVAAQ
jgi:hypothetical protein